MKMLKKVSSLLLLAVILVGSVSVVAKNTPGRSANNEKFKKDAKRNNQIAKNK